MFSPKIFAKMVSARSGGVSGRAPTKHAQGHARTTSKGKEKRKGEEEWSSQVCDENKPPGRITLPKVCSLRLVLGTGEVTGVKALALKG